MRARFSRLLAILLPAIVLGGINALKPVHIDDAIYLRYAQQIVQHPLDPYGFEMFWYQWPENAVWVLCPIGVPYWIALGMAIFGQSVWLLKLWMMPFAMLLMYGIDALLWRATTPSPLAGEGGGEGETLGGDGAGEKLSRVALGENTISSGVFTPHPSPLPQGERGPMRTWPFPWMIALSPVILPGFNLMLDVPAISLSMAALVFMLAACEQRSAKLVLLAGIICGLAILTKWTAFVFLPLLLFVGWKSRASWRGALASGCALLVVIAWESYVALRSGQSHLLFQITVGDGNRGRSESFAGFLPLLGAAAGAALPMLAARWRRMGALAIVVVILAWAGSLFLATPAIPLAVLGVLVLAGLIVASREVWRSSRTSHALLPQLLVLWLVLEVCGYFVLSTFAAMRRMTGLHIAAILVAIVAMQSVTNPKARRWVWASMALSIILGLAINTIDILDARAIRTSATQSIKWAKKKYPDATIYFSGHWGFQYYAEAAGAKAMVPDQTRARAGDIILVNSLTPGPDLLLPTPKPQKELLATDSVPLSAISFHRYFVPLLPQVGPRVRVGVFQMKTDGRVYTNRPPEELVPEIAARAPYIADGAIDALIAGLQFGKPDTQKQAAALIISTGERGILIALSHEDPAVRVWAIRQGVRGPKVRQRIIELLNNDPDPQVREVAREWLQ